MNKDLIILIAIGVGAMLFLALSVVLFIMLYQNRITAINLQKERELTEAAIRAEEEERGRIAAELHDDVGATLASVMRYLQLAEDEGKGSRYYPQSQQLLEESIQKVRSLSHRMQPTLPQRLGLKEALHSFFDVYTKSGALHIEYTGDELPAMPDGTALAIYRIIQELLNNTLKHAAATHAELLTEWNDGVLTIRFSHNGNGITQEMFEEYLHRKNATGLKNMVNRLKILNGSISFDKEPKWYHTIISVPLY